MIAVSSSARSWGVGDRVAALEGALDRAHRAALDDAGARVGRALGGLGDEVGPDEGDLGAGVGEEVVDLAGLEQGVHRHDDAAGQEDAPVDDGEGRDVGEDDRHPVARLDAVGAQRSSDLRGHAVQLGVGDSLAVDPQCGLLGVVRGGRHEVGREVGHRGSCGSGVGGGCPILSRDAVDAPANGRASSWAWVGVEGRGSGPRAMPLRWARIGPVDDWCSNVCSSRMGYGQRGVGSGGASLPDRCCPGGVGGPG